MPTRERSLASKAPEALYAAISGPPNWRSGLKNFGPLPDQNGRKQWWEESQGQRITFELLEDTPPTRRVTRIADKGDPVTDEIWAEAAAHYNERQLAGLLLLIAEINVWNRLNVAVRQVAGAAAVPAAA